MNPNVQRGLLLYQQSRHELAESELRQGLAIDPRDAFAHALLGLCLSKREQFKEATDEAQQAIHLAPDFPFSHYALASILHDRNRDDEALPVINEALRLDASEPDYFALLAAIQLSERRWPAALQAAEQGLRLDSEHVGCTNLRAIALVKLGRKAEAGQTIDAALARDPDNTITHANQGWTYLEKGDPAKALEHFREALRLNPENMWARQGIVEALKAKHFIYAMMLKYFLFMAKLDRRVQWGLIVGACLGVNLLDQVAKTNPGLRPWILPVEILYLAFFLMTWIASPLFNLLLRINRFGRLALSREQTIASNWLGLCLLLVIVSFGGCFVFGFNTAWLMAVLISSALLIPIAGTFKCPKGAPRLIMSIYTGVVACIGIVAIVMLALVQDQHNRKTELNAWNTAMFAFICGLGSSWIMNFLLSGRQRR